MPSTTAGTPRLLRSCLAVPGSSSEMLAKAARLPADEVFLDLEDAVPPDLKNDATRGLVVSALREAGWRAPTLAVRVNAVGTRWCLDDLVTVVSGAGEVLDCVILPKVESAAQILFVAQLLEQLELKHLCNDIYLPTQAELDRAERILDAYRLTTDGKGQGAAVFETELIDEAPRKLALPVVARGRAAGVRSAGA